MTLRFRSLINTPGEPLVSPQLVWETAMRLIAFRDLTGVAEEELTTSSICTTPVPFYRADAGPRRWAHVHPSAMWNPLFWLPINLRQRTRIEMDGVVGLEPNDVWVARILIEMTLSGLYNEADGTWADILGELDLDIDDLDVQARVAAWQAGSPDDILDNIDISHHLDFGDEDPHWSLHAALDSLAALTPVAILISAEDLAARVEGLLESTALSDESLASAARVITNLAVEQFGSAIAGEADWWTSTFEQWSGARDTLTGSVLPIMRERLFQIADTARPETDEAVAIGEELYMALAEAGAVTVSAGAANDGWGDLDEEW